ncbi:hypothetical protein Pd630_LPD16083 (plasmid) [Rhodococcus opacus PD630]|nr:hypothetical protein Pd630_LPD16083 [Rhodococcus opacus PD630]
MALHVITAGGEGVGARAARRVECSYTSVTIGDDPCALQPGSTDVVSG